MGRYLPPDTKEQIQETFLWNSRGIELDDIVMNKPCSALKRAVDVGQSCCWGMTDISMSLMASIEARIMSSSSV